MNQPSHPEVGTLARDTARDKIGRVMEVGTVQVYLRPPGGGVEWEAQLADVQPVSAGESLRSRVAAENARRELFR